LFVDPLIARARGKALALYIARHLEFVTRIFVLAARPPVVAAPLSPAALTLLPQRERRRLFGRPQLAAREPHHHGVGLFRLQLLQRRQQFFLCRGAKRGGLAADDDGPVGVARRH
jgi:hypothetical protein